MQRTCVSHFGPAFKFMLCSCACWDIVSIFNCEPSGISDLDL
jgi:hypothetical protein